MSVCAKFQLSSWSRSGLKVPGGVVGWGGVLCSGVWWLRPILVFTLSLSQAEQLFEIGGQLLDRLYTQLRKNLDISHTILRHISDYS